MLPLRSLFSRRAALRLGALGLGALTLLAGWAPAQAQSNYPTRPITLVVPFPAGGSTDLVARLIASRMVSELGQQIVVENRGGAGGNIGSAVVAKADPDGYTILMGTVATHALNPALYKKMPYDAVKDFTPISLLALIPNVLVVTPNFPAKNVKELIDLVKAKPGEYSYASSGNGTPLHLSGELFKTMAGVNMIHVPYKGAGPALVDVMAGHVPIMFDNLPPSLEQIRAGKLRGLAVTTKERVPSLPDVPTIAETLPGYETYSWNAFFAPAGTPKEIVTKVHDDVLATLQSPDLLERFASVGAEPVGGTQEQFTARILADTAKWAQVIKAAKVKIE